MRWFHSAATVAALAGSAIAQIDSSKYVDTETGVTYSQFVNDKGIAFRVAIPDKVVAGTNYDVIVQISSPKSVGWVGLAWGGSMTYNPLAIVWENGNNVVLSSRMAYGYFVPPGYDLAQYTIFPVGTFVNDTHFQVTAKCSGCSLWGDEDTGITSLDATAQNPLAFAYAAAPVNDPSNNASAFSIHDLIGHWIHDFPTGANADFNATIAKLSTPGSQPPAPTPPSTNGTNATAPKGAAAPKPRSAKFAQLFPPRMRPSQQRR